MRKRYQKCRQQILLVLLCIVVVVFISSFQKTVENDVCSITSMSQVSEGRKNFIDTSFVSPPPTKRRKVSFDSRIVSSVFSSSDETRKMVAPPDQYWYSQQEIKHLQMEALEIVKKRQQNKSQYPIGIEEEEEVLSPSAIQERRRRKTFVIGKVLQEQARQASLKIIDTERLGKESELASKSSRDIAQIRGAVDARTVNDFLYENR